MTIMYQAILQKSIAKTIFFEPIIRQLTFLPYLSTNRTKVEQIGLLTNDRISDILIV